jgi:hypothetical protein
VEHLSLNDGLLAIALLASVTVADDFSLTLAIGADSLEALDHGTHLAHHVLHAAAIAARTLLDGAFFTTSAFALGANDGFLEGELGNLSAVDVLERDFVDVGDCAGLLWASIAHSAAEHASEWASASSKELCEKVLCGHAASAHSTLL